VAPPDTPSSTSLTVPCQHYPPKNSCGPFRQNYGRPWFRITQPSVPYALKVGTKPCPTRHPQPFQQMKSVMPRRSLTGRMLSLLQCHDPRYRTASFCKCGRVKRGEDRIRSPSTRSRGIYILGYCNHLSLLSYRTYPGSLDSGNRTS
jgi:hypothetical protein